MVMASRTWPFTGAVQASGSSRNRPAERSRRLVDGLGPLARDNALSAMTLVSTLAQRDLMPLGKWVCVVHHDKVAPFKIFFQTTTFGRCPRLVRHGVVFAICLAAFKYYFHIALASELLAQTLVRVGF
jgi:hypothetical protein